MRFANIDAAYANKIAELVSGNKYASAAFDTPYGFGMMTPSATLNAMDPAGMENPRDLALGKLGAAGRYGIPAAGIAAAGVGVNAMMNNGTEEQAPRIDVSSIAPQRMFGGANGSPEGELVMAAIRGYGPYPELDALGLNTPEALEQRRQEIMTMMEAEDDRLQVIG